MTGETGFFVVLLLSLLLIPVLVSRLRSKTLKRMVSQLLAVPRGRRVYLAQQYATEVTRRYGGHWNENFRHLLEHSRDQAQTD